MKTEIKSTKNNPLLERREIAFEIQEPSTSSRSKVRRDIAVLLNTNLENVWVKRIETHTGTHRTIGLAHVYDNPDTAIRVEPEHTILRNKIQENVPEPEEKDDAR